ncbi:hypothetical protein ACFPVT_08920 [Corynebacterium choanae]|uniref:Uncharacterized protein n=1 Tax=Corynebacterium choanae TaxID=1862358 RepID=A0A3G6JA97_9CORY|nr:hypothetical protein [Corynebacterium choanae]AZA13390.1 hypothetical protein CCHOA_04910 [Corynebacterium choanae]
MDIQGRAHQVPVAQLPTAALPAVLRLGGVLWISVMLVTPLLLGYRAVVHHHRPLSAAGLLLGCWVVAAVTGVVGSRLRSATVLVSLGGSLLVAMIAIAAVHVEANLWGTGLWWLVVAAATGMCSGVLRQLATASPVTPAPGVLPLWEAVMWALGAVIPAVIAGATLLPLGVVTTIVVVLEILCGAELLLVFVHFSGRTQLDDLAKTAASSHTVANPGGQSPLAPGTRPAGTVQSYRAGTTQPPSTGATPGRIRVSRLSARRSAKRGSDTPPASSLSAAGRDWHSRPFVTQRASAAAPHSRDEAARRHMGKTAPTSSLQRTVQHLPANIRWFVIGYGLLAVANIAALGVTPIAVFATADTFAAVAARGSLLGIGALAVVIVWCVLRLINDPSPTDPRIAVTTNRPQPSAVPAHRMLDLLLYPAGTRQLHKTWWRWWCCAAGTAGAVLAAGAHQPLVIQQIAAVIAGSGWALVINALRWYTHPHSAILQTWYQPAVATVLPRWGLLAAAITAAVVVAGALAVTHTLPLMFFGAVTAGHLVASALLWQLYRLNNSPREPAAAVTTP